MMNSNYIQSLIDSICSNSNDISGLDNQDVTIDESLKRRIISRLKEYALIGERRRMLLDELNSMNIYTPKTSQVKEGSRAKNKKKDISDLLVIKDNKREAYTIINEVYCSCCCYIYDLPISEKSIESILRYIKGKIVGRHKLLDRIATEIAAACNDIDVYLPGMMKNAIK